MKSFVLSTPEQNNQYNYPHLAKGLFSNSATSTPAERTFSKSGIIVNDLRSSLKPDKVNALVLKLITSGMIIDNNIL